MQSPVHHAFIRPVVVIESSYAEPNLLRAGIDPAVARFARKGPGPVRGPAAFAATGAADRVFPSVTTTLLSPPHSKKIIMIGQIRVPDPASGPGAGN
jgi:hypothetical protein